MCREPVGTSGPQGKVIPLTIVDDPADWTAESLKGKKEEYTLTLNDKDVKDIISATNKITSRLPANEESVKAVSLQATFCILCLLYIMSGEGNAPFLLVAKVWRAMICN